MTARKNKNELRRISINLPSTLVERVKGYAEELGLNTTSAYIVLLNQALDQRQSVKSLPALDEMLKYMESIEKNKTEEDKK